MKMQGALVIFAVVVGLAVIKSQVYAMSANVENALKQAMVQKMQREPVALPKMQQLSARLKAAENKVWPLSIWLARTQEAFEQLLKQGRRLLPSDKGVGVNPYTNESWLVGVREDVRDVCCEIRFNPKLQQRIQSVFMKGEDVFVAGKSSDSDKLWKALKMEGQLQQGRVPANSNLKKGAVSPQKPAQATLPAAVAPVIPVKRMR